MLKQLMLVPFLCQEKWAIELRIYRPDFFTSCVMAIAILCNQNKNCLQKLLQHLKRLLFCSKLQDMNLFSLHRLLTLLNFAAKSQESAGENHNPRGSKNNTDDTALKLWWWVGKLSVNLTMVSMFIELYQPFFFIFTNVYQPIPFFSDSLSYFIAKDLLHVEIILGARKAVLIMEKILIKLQNLVKIFNYKPMNKVRPSFS